MRHISAPLAALAAFVGYHGTANATVHVHIDLGSQRMEVNSDSGAHFDWPVSTGRPGHGTPTGAFHPQRMFVMVHSLKYDNAPMPHAIFFYGPYAIHGTNAVYELGHVASHGCVRLSPGNASTLFAMVSHEGARITIGGAPPAGEPVAAVNPHRAGHRLASAQRHRFQQQALSYAPHHQRTLRQWVQNPLAPR